MSYGINDMWRVWRDLERKEDELRWGGYHASGGQQYDSMGRRASSSGHFNAGWAHEQMGRVSRVRQALSDSGPMAQRLVVERLSGINLSTIWHILLSACQDVALYYGGSVAAGGIIGGIGGAFFGGVGAFPGAAAGAAAGSYVGGAVLAMLGLKSLVEEAVEAIPESLGYYQKGFIEAWGPLRQDQQHGFGPSSRGNPKFAAADFAQGHVILVTAILAALVAYLTKGKGDKAALLNEIGRSPRLGPRVARWVEENEARLRQHPALQSRRRGATAAEPPPPPKRRREPDPPRPKGMPKKTVPCFKTKGLPKGKVDEFDRQLAGQEAGINNMTVDEYVKGREAFSSGKSVRDSSIARKAREDYQAKMERQLALEYRKKGLLPGAAKEKALQDAIDKMKTLAALHNPDMVAAGKDKISDFGDRNINSRIGAQWNKGQRLAELDRAASQVPEAMRNTKMNAKLERCK